MNKELIMKSDVLDIIFEKRNKAYGAYNLRKFYNNRLIKSLGLMFAAVVILSAFTFLPEKKGYNARVYEMPKDPELGKAKQPDKKPEPKPKAAVAEPKVTAMKKFLSNMTFVKDKDSTDRIEDLDKTPIGSVTVKIPGPGGPPIIAPPGDSSVAIATPVVKPGPNKTDPVYSPEVMPEFPGGMDALHRFLQRNLTNPEDIQEGSMISVKVQFVVGYDGKLQRFHIIEDGGTAFNNEVMRVLKKMPEWKPGKSNGENVSVYYTIPVKFVPSE